MLNYTYEQEFAAVNPNDSIIMMEDDDNIKMSIGIQNLLSLDFELEHINYNCRGVVKGFVSFNYIHLPIKYIEIQLLKNEVVLIENKREPIVIESIELIDGSPVKNDIIPFRLFLKTYNLTPTYRNIYNIFSVKYYVKIIVGDFNSNTFFKQTEIKLFRVYKEKKNPELNYGPFEEFISEPAYNEEYYKENNNINENKKNDNINKEEKVEEEEEEEDEEDEEEDEKDEDKNNNEFIIDTSSNENKKEEKKKNKKGKRQSKIVNILRSNSMYNSSNTNILKDDNINNIQENQNNNSINIPFNDEEVLDDNFISSIITTNFPTTSNNELFNDESNININNEIITSSINNSKYSKINKFDE